jgi:5-methylcytosine-specific restriction endonuclease McrA
MKVRISRQDAEFSRLIRERDSWRCRKCHTAYAPNSRGLHCAHIVGRRNRELRWDERNAVSLCFSCHLWAHGNPIQFVDWVKDEIGVKTYNWLRRVAATPKKVRNTQRHA